MKIKDSKYILYGAASIGNIVKESFEKRGLEIVGYIDKRGYEITQYNGLPVWEIDSVPEKYINEGVIIYISVKNVFEHEQIARTLEKNGFNNIIYKPYSTLLGHGNKSEYEMAELYDKLFDGVWLQEMDLPIIKSNSHLHDFAIIKEDEMYVTAYIPVEFIFTNDYSNLEMEKWGNINIAAFFTHIDFFRFLNNDMDAIPKDYLQEYCIHTANIQKKIKVTDAWKNNVVENRTQIYEQMKVAMDLDPDFFIRSAAEATWNAEKKYFNLTSGKHRCTFQAAIGKKYIPLKIAKEDYNSFFNASEIASVTELVQQESSELLVPHPCFYREIYMRERSEGHFFLWFARYYGRRLYNEKEGIRFDKLKIIDYSKDFGNFSRFCARMGCLVQRRREPGLLEKQLNKLFYADNIQYYMQDKNSEEEKLIIVDSEDLGIVYEQLSINTKISWIIKYGLQNKIEEFAKKNGLNVVTVINAKWQQGQILKSFLLE